ncbi:MAG: sigma-54-dependent Fis family transcriptional regulator, partial [Myxococcales bacterium]|nr:sigma-54-dependent Fis family transcriptional regulator [Myxococcales bacterium]
AVLARHFLAEVTSAVGPKLLTPDAEACLELHSWPGNARELRNVVCAAAASCAGMHVDAEHVRAAVALLSADGAPDVVDAAQIDAALERHGGNVTQAARALGVPRSTLRDRIRRSTPPPADDGT